MPTQHQTHAIAIYGLPQIEIALALNIADEFFKQIKITPIDASYTAPVKKSTDDEEFYLRDTDIEGLRLAIQNGLAKDFILTGQEEGNSNRTCNFHYKTDAFARGARNSIYQSTIISIFDSPNADIGNLRTTCSLLKLITPHIHIPYGITFQAEDASFAYIYSIGQSFLKLSNNENPRLWRDQMPIYLEEKEPAYLNKIRMVYPINLITDRHLKQTIEGISLKDWIETTPARGRITKMGHLSIWEVDVESLNIMNRACGQAGISLCWKDDKIPTAKRKLP